MRRKNTVITTGTLIHVAPEPGYRREWIRFIRIICPALFLMGNLSPLFMRKKQEPVSGATELVFNRFCFRPGLRKEEIVATQAANEIMLHILKLGLYGASGLLNIRVLMAGPLITVSAVSSSFVMRIAVPPEGRKRNLPVVKAGWPQVSLIYRKVHVTMIQLLEQSRFTLCPTCCDRRLPMPRGPLS